MSNVTKLRREIALANALLTRACKEQDATTIQEEVLRIQSQMLQFAVDRIYETLTEAPDAHWLRDYYVLTETPMVLTDEGWQPPDVVDDDCEILDRVCISPDGHTLSTVPITHSL